MSFAKTFQQMHEVSARDPNHVARMVSKITSTFDDTTPTDAFLLNETLCRALMRALQVIGEEIDSVAPRLQSKALPLIIDVVPNELTILNQMTTLLVLGMDGPSEGCDCSSCRQKKLLCDELDTLEAIVKQAENRG